MKLSALSVNPEAIENGEWVENIPECGDLKILSKGVNNAAFRELRQKLVAAVPRNERRTGISDKTSRQIQRQCVIETCTLDWKNLEADDSTPEKPVFIPYSKEMHWKLSRDPRFEPFMDACIVAAAWVGETKVEDATEAAGN